jgi:hypothetical protein
MGEAVHLFRSFWGQTAAYGTALSCRESEMAHLSVFILKDTPPFEVPVFS